MKVILLTDVSKVGQRYDVKNVADGFAMNKLIPQKLAQIATEGALKKIETQKKKLEAEREQNLHILIENIEKIQSMRPVISAKVNDKGHLFASISKDVIAHKISEDAGLKIDESRIEILKPIKSVGTHKVNVRLGEKTVALEIEVKAE